MRANARQALETDAPTENRAQVEAFECAVAGDVVWVTSGCHDDPDAHTGKGKIDEWGDPTSCTCASSMGCTSSEFHSGACKQVAIAAVAIRDAILEGPRTGRTLSQTCADFGVIVATGESVFTEASAGKKSLSDSIGAEMEVM